MCCLNELFETQPQNLNTGTTISYISSTSVALCITYPRGWLVSASQVTLLFSTCFSHVSDIRQNCKTVLFLLFYKLAQPKSDVNLYIYIYGEITEIHK